MCAWFAALQQTAREEFCIGSQSSSMRELDQKRPVSIFTLRLQAALANPASLQCALPNGRLPLVTDVTFDPAWIIEPVSTVCGTSADNL